MWYKLFQSTDPKAGGNLTCETWYKVTGESCLVFVRARLKYPLFEVGEAEE